MTRSTFQTVATGILYKNKSGPSELTNRWNNNLWLPLQELEVIFSKQRTKEPSRLPFTKCSCSLWKHAGHVLFPCDLSPELQGATTNNSHIFGSPNLCLSEGRVLWMEGTAPPSEPQGDFLRAVGAVSLGFPSFVPAALMLSWFNTSQLVDLPALLMLPKH